MFNDLISLIESNLQPCWFKQLTGADCPGCGVQRAFLLLLKGEIGSSFLMYPALIPVIFLFVFLLIHLFAKFKKGGTYLMYNFLLVMMLIIGNYMLKFFQ